MTFGNASLFNQELCSRGQNYTTLTNYSDMFAGSGCPHTNTPSSKEGQWCRSCPTMCTGGDNAFPAGNGGQGGVLYNAVRNYEANVNKYGLQWTVGM